MIREFTIRTDEFDESASYAVYSNGDIYIEVPYTDDDTSLVQNKIDSALVTAAMSEFRSGQIRDDVYVNGEIIRQDYSIGHPEGATILEELETAFPEYADFSRSELNIVGKYDGYREPYQNPSISWYDFVNYPSEQLQLNFGTSYLNSSLLHWYGLKFDMVTNAVMLKVLIRTYDAPKPELPEGNTFYSLTHFEDGSIGEWVDSYVFATPKRIREFCADKGLDYPLQPTTHLECDVVWCWGIVFNKDTLEYGAVKAYARYNIA